MMMVHSVVEERVKEVIRARTGLYVRDEERARLRKAISTRVHRLHLSDPSQYCDVLSRTVTEWDELMPLLTTGETYFLRDQGQCEVLENEILPRLIDRNRHRGSLRLWSAGCSTGEEAYSLAILVDKLLPDRREWDIRIVGTDINPQALETARRGRYGDWSFRMLKSDFRARYFHQHGSSWEVAESIRSMVTFRSGNLVADHFPDTATSLCEMDLVLCRNVFIYFHRDTIGQVLRKLTATLVPGGYLLTGHAELHGQELGPLRLRLLPGAVVFERTNGETIASECAVARQAPWDETRRPAPGTTWTSTLSRPEQSAADGRSTALPPGASGQRNLAERAAAAAAAYARGAPESPNRTTDAAQRRLPVPAPPTNAVAALLREARAQFERGDYRKAIATAQKATTVDPGCAQAILLAANAHANLAEHAAALKSCQRVLECDPLNAEAYYLMGHLAEERGDREDVKRLLKKVLYIDASSVAAYLELATLYDAEGDAVRSRQMRLAALQLLKTLSPDAGVPHWPGLTAGQLRLTVESLVVRQSARTGHSTARS